MDGIRAKGTSLELGGAFRVVGQQDLVTHLKHMLGPGRIFAGVIALAILLAAKKNLGPVDMKDGRHDHVAPKNKLSWGRLVHRVTGRVNRKPCGSNETFPRVVGIQDLFIKFEQT